MSFISASNLPRISVCPPSAFLPKDAYSSSKNAVKGTNIHKFIADCISIGEKAARETMPARFNGRSLIERLQAPVIFEGLEKIQSEVAVRWDGVTDECSILGYDIGRNYYKNGARDWDIVGSIDIIAYNASTGNLVVADVKTGMQEINPVTSEQLQVLAYISSQVFENTGSVETRIIKINEDGSVTHKAHLISPNELAILKLKFKGLREKVLDNLDRYQRQEKLDLLESDFCNWCPSKSSCPLKQPAFNTLPVPCQSVAAAVESN